MSCSLLKFLLVTGSLHTSMAFRKVFHLETDSELSPPWSPWKGGEEAPQHSGGTCCQECRPPGFRRRREALQGAGTCQGTRQRRPMTQARLQPAGLADPGHRAVSGDLQGEGTGSVLTERMALTFAYSH